MKFRYTPSPDAAEMDVTDREAIVELARQIKRHVEWHRSANRRRVIEKILNDSRQLWLTRRFYFETHAVKVKVEGKKQLLTWANNALKSRLRDYCALQRALLKAVQNTRNGPDQLEKIVHKLEREFNVSLLP